MARPNVPGQLWINGVAETSGKATMNMDGTVAVSAVLSDPNGGNVRLMVRYSTDPKFKRFYTVYSKFGPSGTRRGTVMTRLNRNSRYYVRAFAQSMRPRQFSANYNSTNFYTNRAPNPPPLVAPAENSTFPPGVNITFDWQHSDPDGAHAPLGYQIALRQAASPIGTPAAWKYFTQNTGGATSRIITAANFKASTQYEWMVRTRDNAGLWGAWSLMRSFTVEGVTRPPLLLSPISGQSVLTDNERIFRWQFRDPITSSTQGNADIRYRAVGSTPWIENFGTAHTAQEWSFPADTFAPGIQYEWQVRTTRASGLDPISDWSESGFFWTMLTPGSLAAIDLPLGEGEDAVLGCGTHKAFIFDRGGKINRGEITPITFVQWGRKRDDIADLSVTVTGFDQDCGELLGSVRSWMHELVIYRDGKRVAEGPVTHIQYRPGEVIISAKDVMAYAYRRILRQGYNDSTHKVGGVEYGLSTVVERGELILRNALAYAEPNVLPYMTPVHTGQDARQSRIVPDYTKTAWEEIDDLAANAGLDYCTVGRRILLWDTHQYLGVLPEMRDSDFSEPPVVTEYGMSMANYFAVTDGQGLWGAAYPIGKTATNWYDAYGPVEQLASGYGDTTIDISKLTPAIRDAHQKTLSSQAARNIQGRWPTPLVARVPDNSTIHPDVHVTIDQLVPGVWIPLRVENIVRPFGQMQKLDSVTVTQDKDGEKVAVVMSPAPADWEDPDSAAVEQEEA